jgi:hypothetical protein
MEDTNAAQSRYFQTIAQEFYKRRGAPFFLSSKDLVLIAKWEKMAIPLQIVLEGMEKSFESRPGRPRTRSKVLTLGYCEAQVMKAFSQHQERRVGRPKKTGPRGEKSEKVVAEVGKFLARVPPELSFLNEVFERALALLSRSEVDEEALEALEDEVEEKLFRLSSEGLKDRFRKIPRSELSPQKQEDAERILRRKLVKHLRDKHKIPYLSLFYY